MSGGPDISLAISGVAAEHVAVDYVAAHHVAPDHVAAEPAQDKTPERAGPDMDLSIRHLAIASSSNWGCKRKKSATGWTSQKQHCQT
jgi:hypothetical protein